MDQGYQTKEAFVAKLNEAIRFGGMGRIVALEYEVYKSTINSKWIAEFLVATYDGGVRMARACTGNSNAAIVEELAKMLYDPKRLEPEQGYYAMIQGHSIKLN